MFVGVDAVADSCFPFSLRCLSFNGVTQCNDGVACRKWHVYVPLKDTLDAKVRLKSPLYAKGKIFRTSIRHKESTTDGRRWFTAGYKNDDLRKIFYAEGKGRNKKGFQDASGVWWYPSLDDAELALVTVIASAHNATASNDNANQQDAVLESEAGSVSARNSEPAPPNQPNTSECDIDPSASLANRRSLEVDQFPGLEKNSVTGFEIRPTEQLKETNASTQECRVSSEMVHDSAPPSGAPPSGLCLSSKDDRGADTGAGAPVSRLSPSSRDDRATASQLSKGRDSSQSAPRSSSAKPSSSPPSHRHAAPSHHASGAVREYAKLGDSQSVGRPHGHAYEHSRSDRSYGRGDRSSSREYAPSHRADSASLRHPQGGERGRRSESSDRPDYRSAHHEVEQHGSRRHYSSEGDSRSAYGASSESSRRPSTAALDRHHAAAPTEPESYHHHRSWWTERPPPVAAATASHYHHRFPQQHQQQEYHRQQPDYHHNADYYRAAPPPTSGTTPTFAYADLPHKWERKPPHVLLRGTHHGSSHQVIYVDGDYYKWFGTSWICRGPTYPD